MKLEGFSRRVKVGVRRDRLLVATLDLIRDVKSRATRSYSSRNSLVKRMGNNQLLIKRYREFHRSIVQAK